MAVKLAGSLPDEERSGMDRLKGHLLKNPERRHVVIMVVDCATESIDYRKEQRRTPTAGIQFIEPLTDRDDITEALELLARVRAERLNDSTLDFDFGVEDPLAEAARHMREQGFDVTVTTTGGED